MTDTNFGPCPPRQSNEIIWLSTGTADAYNRSGIRVTVFKSISFARHICLQWGLVREWVANRKDLDILRKNYG